MHLQAVEIFGVITIYSYSSFLCRVGIIGLPFDGAAIESRNGVSFSLSTKLYGESFHKV